MSKSLNIRVFKHKILIDALTESELYSLTKDFRHYKETGQKPDLFGRDEAYDHPDTFPILKSEEVKQLPNFVLSAPLVLKMYSILLTTNVTTYCLFTLIKCGAA